MSKSSTPSTPPLLQPPPTLPPPLPLPPLLPTIEHPPHVHRLLRLIREGTSCHASRASSLLGKYAASCTSSGHLAWDNQDARGGDKGKHEKKSKEISQEENINPNANYNSALIIWDLIGRLVDGGGDVSNRAKDGRDNFLSGSNCSGLFDPTWSTRSNCSMALAAVARCLPWEDRVHFFFEGGSTAATNNSTGKRDGPGNQEGEGQEVEGNLMWLNVHELSKSFEGCLEDTKKSEAESFMKGKPNVCFNPSKGGYSNNPTNQLDIVMEKGRLLLSSSGEKYDWSISASLQHDMDDSYSVSAAYSREQEALHRLDATAIKYSQNSDGNVEEKNRESSSQTVEADRRKSFLMRRIRLQRLILARRLGLEGILSAPIVDSCSADKSIKGDHSNIEKLPSIHSCPTAASTNRSNSSLPSRRRRFIDDIVNDEDFLSEYLPPSESKPSDSTSSGAYIEQHKPENTLQDAKIERYKKRRKICTETSKRGSNETSTKSMGQHSETIGIRALLVLESNRSSAFKYTDRSIDVNGNPINEIGIDAYRHKAKKSARHRSPQTLLGCELAYRTFDADWTVRHGALLGTLALLRAWKVHDDPQKDGDYRSYDGDDRAIDRKLSRIDEPVAIHQQRFGKWPHDILARCVCILALDRFADFSGTAIAGNRTASNTNSGGNNESRNDSARYAVEDIASGAIVAPVREVAAQIIAILLEAAPWDVWKCTHSLLMHLYNRTLNNNMDTEATTRRGWEIRHGVLLAWKYTCSMSFICKKMINGRSSSSSTSNIRLNYCSTYDEIIVQCIQGLKDKSDDVRGVSAQVLVQFLRADENLYNVNIVEECTASLWSVISEIRGDVSSCASDILALFAETLARDCKTVLFSLEAASSIEGHSHDLLSQSLLGSVLLKLAEFVNFSSSNVRISCFNALSLVVEPITKTVMDSTSCGEEAESRVSEQYIFNFAAILCHLMRKIFETHFTLRWFGDDDTNSSNMEFSVRDNAWIKLLDVFPLVGNAPAQFVNKYQNIIAETIVTLTLRYFGIIRLTPNPTDHVENSCHTSQFSLRRVQEARYTNEGVASEQSYYAKLTSASALAQVYKAISASNITPHEISFFISSMLLTTIQSPWYDQCEAAYILHTAILSSGDTNFIKNDFDGYLPLLVGSLVDTPICVALENNHATSTILCDRDIQSTCDKGLASLLDDLMHHPSKCMKNDDGSFWEKLLNQRDVSLTRLCDGAQPLTKMSMRLSASIAGAIVSCGRNNLPPKITPLIRSLMTSLKNVDSDTRKRETSRHLSNLVTIMMDDPQFEKTRCKVLTNLCNLACETMESGADESNACQWAKFTLKLIISSSNDHYNLQKFSPIWKRLSVLSDDDKSTTNEGLSDAIVIINIASESLPKKSLCLHDILNSFSNAIIEVACDGESEDLRSKASLTVVNFCSIHVEISMEIMIPTILPILGDIQNDTKRTRCCGLLLSMIQEMGVTVSPFVLQLLPVAMRLMTDPIEECAKLAASIFALLVRVAPLSACYIDEKHTDNEDKDSTNHVVRHLILGKPLPPCKLPERISSTLSKGGISLRPYQMEGITWLNFLRQVHLNGALCDDMGLGKTLMALVAVAMSQHINKNQKEITQCSKGDFKTLIICPSSVVGHWISEISRFFPGNDVFIPFDFTGAVRVRRSKWRDRIEKCNIVVTNYSTLRSDIDLLNGLVWNYCILDEGHLLKNPSTATAKASRRLKALHKLILTGTPIQNHVNEIWATFDFLMPNFLGSEKQFRSDFALPIGKSQSLDASGDDIALGTECLKILHQQVLPFVLRREKSQVIKELPPKIVTDVPCILSEQQATLYHHLVKQSKTKIAIDTIDKCLNGDSDIDVTLKNSVGNDVLSSILQLRLICTHPILQHLYSTKNVYENSKYTSASESISLSSFSCLDCSGKLSALNDLLRHSGIAEAEMTAADNDTSAFMVDMDNDAMDMDDDDEMIEEDVPHSKNSNSKCLIFAQFTQSLDVVEKFLLEPHMPSLRYLRLDGSVAMTQRNSIVNRFNQDHTVKVLLLTTKVGGLGLNLTGADKVIFLEPDWNPYVDLQAMDRAHRIGQTKTVNVYRLITSNTIEEKIMQLQRRKKATSDAVVNTENSAMFSMGTDRLLDIFTFSGSGSTAAARTEDDGRSDNALNYLDDHSDEYASLSVKGFLNEMTSSSISNQI